MSDIKQYYIDHVNNLSDKVKDNTLKPDHVLLPLLDPRVKHMKLDHPNPTQFQTNNNQGIPKIVHQVWVGNKPVPSDTEFMKGYCERFGYQYYLWTENNLHLLTMSDAVSVSLKRQLIRKCWRGASNIIRYLAIRQLGGFYLDCDYIPKRHALPLHDMADGDLTLTLEWGARNIETAALFVENSFIAAIPEHPIIEHVLQNLPSNEYSVVNSALNGNSVTATGPMLLNKCLYGNFGILHPTKLYHYFDRVNHNI